jgi:membrane protein
LRITLRVEPQPGLELDQAPDAAPGPLQNAAAIVRGVAGRVRTRNIHDRAAALSYYFLFALFPTLLFVAAILGSVPGAALMDHLMRYVARVLPNDAAMLVSRTLGEVVTGAGAGLISVGALGALWGASTGMVSIMTALNISRGVVDDRRWWERRLIALALTLGFSLFTVTALLLLVFGEWIGEAVASAIGLGAAFTQGWRLAQWPVATLCVLTGISLVYTLAPARRPRWRSVSPGSVVALSGWLAMSFGLRLYVRFFDTYNATYGSIGGVILLMLWLYLSSLLLLVGAEINAVVEEGSGPRSQRNPP